MKKKKEELSNTAFSFHGGNLLSKVNLEFSLSRSNSPPEERKIDKNCKLISVQLCVSLMITAAVSQCLSFAHNNTYVPKCQCVKEEKDNKSPWLL